MFRKEKKKINLVYDDDLKGMLRKLGVLDDFAQGRKKCKFCKNIINMKNLHSLFKESEDVKFVCDSPECIKKLLTYLK
ncbi:hypothetical protein KAI56_00390 [Candidatus Parcubacteria bacterium]|nr:hypothetical protein [Candidatus Parcubacteria bacterium]